MCEALIIKPKPLWLRCLSIVPSFLYPLILMADMIVHLITISNDGENVEGFLTFGIHWTCVMLTFPVILST
jgi:hypothetical protein